MEVWNATLVFEKDRRAEGLFGRGVCVWGGVGWWWWVRLNVSAFSGLALVEAA